MVLQFFFKRAPVFTAKTMKSVADSISTFVQLVCSGENSYPMLRKTVGW